uniref:Dynein heavy chain tail domain-containing protein n=1 Tax=Amphiprion ocellaris TaxID=80972 RepID=A0A3Q1CEC5_AMPOC
QSFKVSECGRSYPAAPKGGNVLRLFLADLSKTCLTGICCSFLRFRVDVAVNAENIHEEVFFSMVDARDGLLKGIQDACNFPPLALDAVQNWGALDKSRRGEKIKNKFKHTIKQRLGSLEDIRMRNEAIVHLHTVTDTDFSKLTCLDDMKAAAANFDMVQQLEEILKKWCKQIEILVERDILRKLDDSEGPRSELEYWKKWSLRFNSIIQQVNSPEFRAVEMVLNIAHSKILKMWQDLDVRLTHHANEAKANVNFLSTFEKVCQPLYNSDPVCTSVQNIIRIIETIYNVSPYYKRKVTNQMVMACRSYITDDGRCLVWDRDAEDLKRKMQVVVALHICVVISEA